MSGRWNILFARVAILVVAASLAAQN